VTPTITATRANGFITTPWLGRYSRTCIPTALLASIRRASAGRSTPPARLD
jgi:hypothetical protein